MDVKLNERRAGPAAAGEPNVSDVLEELRVELEREQLTVGELLEALHKRGSYFILLVLSVPFLQPIALPGVSTPFGLLLALLAIGLLLDRNMTVPQRIAQFALPRKGVSMLFGGSVRLFRKLERRAKPGRMAVLVESKGMLRFHALLAMIAAVLLMLPLPIPFSNSLPAYVIACVALGYLLRDGAVQLFAYGFAVLTGLYFALIAALGIEGLQLLFRQLWGA